MFLINTPRIIITETSLWNTGLVTTTNPDLRESFAEAIIADQDDQLELLRQWHLHEVDFQNVTNLNAAFDAVVSAHLVPKMKAWLSEGEELCVQCKGVAAYRLWKEDGEVMVTPTDFINSEFSVSAGFAEWIRMMILPEFLEEQPQ